MASSTSRWAPPVYSLLLSVLVLGPLLGPGYLLLRDAVSTPRSYLTDAALGTTDAAARAVPQDAFVATLSTVVDGGVVVKVVLLLALWLAGWGAARMSRALLPTAPTPALLTASTVAIWNPYVAERLLQGHWSLLVGYAALPWTVSAALTLRRTGRWAPLAVCLAAAGLTPTGAVLAAIVALAVSGTLRRGLITSALAITASLPWLVATAVSGGGTTSTDPAGVAAFAARAEPGLGTIGSLAGLGGIWNADAVPTSRTSLFAVVGTALLLAVVALGILLLWRRRRHPYVLALGVVAVVAVVSLALAATSPGLHVGEWAATHVPGAGLLRDAQKWVALAMPFYALASAAGVTWAAARLRNAWLPGIAAMLAVLIALPDLVWGVAGQIRPVDYPSSWHTVAEKLEGDTGDVAVLPAGMFRIFPYSGDAPVLDPAPRMLPLDVLQTGELIVAGGSVRGEGSRAESVESVLLAGGSVDELRRLGVGWVLVERTTPGQLGESQTTLDQLDSAYSDDELALYRIPDALDASESGGNAAVVAAHLVWFALLAGGFGVAIYRREG
ncbi:hypothetical protein [Rhodococcoides kyotonense]|uniref:Transmembrane protein n=1 Tax=Rhodococcoides kyotonense TaxID=398843 RepID=A0A239JCD4_9NOCA|nr:hypothetical protein [Rhodococcus kyotonensis]SNT03088.1 hypothetical protein SAMN05421642_108139 [Rhodococcus kyotonensis]